MTPRGRAILLASVIVIAVGVQMAWPELAAAGAAGTVAVVLVVLALGTRPKARLHVDQGTLRVVRGQVASVRVGIRNAPRRRGVRLVEGERTQDPSASLALSPALLATSPTLRVPLDTSERGQRPMGPFTLLHGDPWGLVARVVDRAEGGIVTIWPRTFPIRRALITHNAVGDSESADKRRGDVHFHALRDYVLGDEPRSIHWRSSARAGHLVVKQNLAPSSIGTLVVLDTDITAYGSDHQFGAGFVAERFETAVEVTASIVASLPASSGKVHLAGTEAGSPLSSATPGAVNSLLDRLAVIQAARALEVQPEALAHLVRATRASRLIVVTGTPTRALPRAVQAAMRSVPGTLVIRVGATDHAPIPGIRLLDLESAEDLL